VRGRRFFTHLKKQLSNAGLNTNVGDEGGFAPAVKSSEEALNFIMKSIEAAGYKAGSDVVIALDSASTEFYKDGKYHLEGEGKVLSSDEMIRYYEGLCAKYPIVSIEDGLAEDDWAGWKNLTKALGSSVQLVGDDLYVTNSKRLKRGIDENSGNAVSGKGQPDRHADGNARDHRHGA
jgi:enolase